MPLLMLFLARGLLTTGYFSPLIPIKFLYVYRYCCCRCCCFWVAADNRRSFVLPSSAHNECRYLISPEFNLRFSRCSKQSPFHILFHRYSFLRFMTIVPMVNQTIVEQSLFEVIGHFSSITIMR